MTSSDCLISYNDLRQTHSVGHNEYKKKNKNYINRVINKATNAVMTAFGTTGLALGGKFVNEVIENGPYDWLGNIDASLASAGLLVASPFIIYKSLPNALPDVSEESLSNEREKLQKEYKDLRNVRFS